MSKKYLKNFIKFNKEMLSNVIVEIAIWSYMHISPSFGNCSEISVIKITCILSEIGFIKINSFYLFNAEEFRTTILSVRFNQTGGIKEVSPPA